MAADIVLLREILGEKEVFGEEDREEGERLWVRIKPDVVVFAEPALGLRLGEEATLANFDLLSESSRCTGTGILEEDIIQLLWVESSDALDDPNTSMG